VSAYLIYDLAVDGRGGREIDANLRRGGHFCILYKYTIQYGAGMSSPAGLQPVTPAAVFSKLTGGL
jgi:hypothetical protein